MKKYFFYNILLLLCLSFIPTTVSAQKFLKKLNKTLTTVNNVLGVDSTANKTDSLAVAADSTAVNPADTLTAEQYMKQDMPEFEVRVVTMTDSQGDTLRNEDGSVKQHFLLYDKEGNLTHPDIAKKLVNSSIKSGAIILLKIGGAAAAGGGIGKKAGGKKGALWGSLIGAAVGTALSANDIKNIKAKLGTLREVNAALDKYKQTFTLAGEPIDKTADLSEFTDGAKTSTEDKDAVIAALSNVKIDPEEEGLDDMDSKLDELLKEEEKAETV